jgi:hypothetical protein
VLARRAEATETETGAAHRAEPVSSASNVWL